MSWLIWLAVGLVVLWIVALLLGWVIGAAIHLFWIAALVLLAVWLFKQGRRYV